MMEETLEPEGSPTGKHILPVLILSRLAARPHGILMTILLVDVALSFGVPVGVMSQIRSLSSVVSMAFAFAMGVLSIRYRPKPLLMVGLSLLVVSALGCSFAPTYTVMLISFSLTGIGVAMVTPMSQTLVGEHIDVEDRPRAISYMLMSFTLVSAFVSGPVINRLAVLGGWRLAYLAYVFPVAIIGFAFAYFGIPPSRTESGETPSYRTYIEAFRDILTDRSALACITCSALCTASFQTLGVYGMSYFVERFGISSAWRAPMWSVLTFTGAMGSYLSGRLVTRLGRRSVSIVGALMTGVFAAGSTNADGFWPSFGLLILCGVGWTIWYPASTSLTLEQMPRLRGSMMSLNDAARSLGVALGSGIGGFILLNSGYGVLGLILGSLGVAASAIYRLFAVDPTRT